MTNESITEIINEVANKHHVILGQDDPILILHTINQRLLRENTQAQKELLEVYKSELEALIKRWQEEAQQTAEKIINASLTTGKRIMTEKAEELSHSFQSEIQESTSHINQGSPHRLEKLIFFNIFASSLTFITLVTFFLWNMGVFN